MISFVIISVIIIFIGDFNIKIYLNVIENIEVGFIKDGVLC